MQESKRPLQALLCDLDGTLADSLAALKSAYYEFLSLHGVAGNEEEFNRLNGPSLKEIVAIVRKQYSLTPELEELIACYMQLLERQYTGIVQPFEGAQELLSALLAKKVRLALVTSTSRSLAQTFLDAHSWLPYFEVVITGDEVHRAKPDPQIYKTALAALDVQAETAMAIEDSVNGVLAARNAGLRVLGVSAVSAERLLAAGAESVVGNLLDITDALEIAGLDALA